MRFRLQNCLLFQDVARTNDMDKLRQLMLEFEAIILMPLKPHGPVRANNPRPQTLTCLGGGRHDSGSDSGTEQSEGGTEGGAGAAGMPQPPAAGGAADVPTMIFDTLQKMVMIIFLSESVNHEVVTVFACLLNRCLRREAFSVTHKQKISSWLQRMRTLWNPPQILKANDYRRR